MTTAPLPPPSPATVAASVDLAVDELAVADLAIPTAPGSTGTGSSTAPITADLAAADLATAGPTTADPALATAERPIPAATELAGVDLAGADRIAVPDGLVVLSTASWPVTPAEPLPQIAGFVVSAFNPLVAEVAERCLRAYHGEPPAGGGPTGVVLASVHGDVTTARATADAVRAGRRVPPLLFFQSNPNAVVGHVTARWGLTGPVVCTSPTLDPVADGLAEAALLIGDGDAADVLVVWAELATPDGAPDRAVALLVGPGTAGPVEPEPVEPAPAGPAPVEPGSEAGGHAAADAKGSRSS